MSTAVTQEQIEKVVVESLESFGADPEQITPEATLRGSSTSTRSTSPSSRRSSRSSSASS